VYWRTVMRQYTKDIRRHGREEALFRAAARACRRAR
jgi:hypothetical protein